jgi:hypothetical protein
MNFSERTFKDRLGATVIQSRLRPASGRGGLKNSCSRESRWVYLAGKEPTAKETALALKAPTQFVTRQRRQINSYKTQGWSATFENSSN